jgi:muramoyltetrapeptide carboxypeptidase
LINNPKWIVGFSDVTVLHAAVNNAGVQTIHGAMANNFNDNTSVTNLKNALFGTYSGLSIPTNSNCIQGQAEGRLVGGNLTTFYALGGTIEDLNMKDAILFFEDTGEAHHNVDRMLSNLKLSGKLNEIKGVIVGQFTDMRQSASDRPVNEIILNQVKDLGIPVMYGVSVGHGSPNLPLYLGRKIQLDVGATTSTILF